MKVSSWNRTIDVGKKTLSRLVSPLATSSRSAQSNSPPQKRASPHSFPPLPELSEFHLKNCRVLPNRYAGITTLPKGGKIIEVGTQTGKFGRFLHDTLEPSEMHVVDIDVSIIRQSDVFADKPEIIVHEGDSATILESFPDKYFDMIYIDADHSYRGVSRDSHSAIKKVKDDGIIIFNDYVYWSIMEQSPYGVPLAVHELCLAHNLEFSYIALHPHMYIDVAVKKITPSAA